MRVVSQWSACEPSTRRERSPSRMSTPSPRRSAARCYGGTWSPAIRSGRTIPLLRRRTDRAAVPGRPGHARAGGAGGGGKGGRGPGRGRGAPGAVRAGFCRGRARKSAYARTLTAHCRARPGEGQARRRYAPRRAGARQVQPGGPQARGGKRRGAPDRSGRALERGGPRRVLRQGARARKRPGPARPPGEREGRRSRHTPGRGGRPAGTWKSWWSCSPPTR